MHSCTRSHCGVQIVVEVMTADYPANDTWETDEAPSLVLSCSRNHIAQSSDNDRLIPNKFIAYITVLGYMLVPH